MIKGTIRGILLALLMISPIVGNSDALDWSLVGCFLYFALDTMGVFDE